MYRCQHIYSCLNKKVQVLDQELREWQARSANVERQLDIAHQVNRQLYRQLRKPDEGKDVYFTNKSTPHLPIETSNSSPQQFGQQSWNLNSKEKDKQKRCQYCKRMNHEEEKRWRKNKKCLQCGSSEHQVRNCSVKKKDIRQSSYGISQALG